MISPMVFHFIFFLFLNLGLFFSAQSRQLVYGTEGFLFLNGTELSSENPTDLGPNSKDSAKVENEEQEEKEENESESENDGPDVFYAKTDNGLPNRLTAVKLSDSNRQFISYSKVKLYLLFHCLKSDLA